MPGPSPTARSRRRRLSSASSAAPPLIRDRLAGAIDRGRLAYVDAKAEYDAIIAGLGVALVRNDPPASLPDLEARLRRGFDKRQAFCASVKRYRHRPRA